MYKLLRRIVDKLLPPPPPSISGPFSCPVCKTENINMAPLPMRFLSEQHKYQHIHNPYLSETANIEFYSCYNCWASDRDRLYALYLDGYFKNHPTASFLDIAPAPALSKYIKNHKSVQYRSMDLFMEGVDDRLDITDMHAYENGKFDFVMCSHVLEHIPDDRKAMGELYRVMKPGGKGIMMVPINLGVEQTLEDPAITSVGDRWKYFGQDDHVRMYARKDFIERLEASGFQVEQLGIEHFGREVFERHAIYPTSVLYVVSK